MTTPSRAGDTPALIYLAFHAGHAHANYRHGRACGHRGINLYWSSARGPWISIPGPRATSPEPLAQPHCAKGEHP